MKNFIFSVCLAFFLALASFTSVSLLNFRVSQAKETTIKFEDTIVTTAYNDGSNYYFAKKGNISYSGSTGGSLLYGLSESEFLSNLTLSLSQTYKLLNKNTTVTLDNATFSINSFSVTKQGFSSATTYTVNFNIDYEIIQTKAILASNTNFFDNLEDVTIKLVFTSGLKSATWTESTDGLSITMENKLFNISYYDFEGGILLSSEDLEYYMVPTYPVTPTRNGYTFQGWSQTIDHITANVIIYGTWQIQTFTVSYYDYEGGSLLKSETVNYGDNSTAPATPTRAGHEWLGWSTAANNVTADLNIYGLWEKTLFKVDFYDFEGGTLLQSDYVEAGAILTAPKTPERYGYIWLGWSTTDYLSVTGDLIVYGTWQIKTYNVYFYDYDGGSLLKTETVNYCDGATAPITPTRTGYEWLGWSCDFNYITGDLVVYGTWQVKTCVISFYDYDGGNLLATSIYNYGAKVILPETPTRTGYIWQGWSKNITYATENMTVYGLWEKDLNYFNGYAKGLEDGYKNGYNDCKNTLDNSEANSKLSTLIFAIFDAPFNVVRNALNFELFGINLTNFILTIFSLILLAWVIGKLL